MFFHRCKSCKCDKADLADPEKAKEAARRTKEDTRRILDEMAALPTQTARKEKSRDTGVALQEVNPLIDDPGLLVDPHLQVNTCFVLNFTSHPIHHR